MTTTLNLPRIVGRRPRTARLNERPGRATATTRPTLGVTDQERMRFEHLVRMTPR